MTLKVGQIVIYKRTVKGTYISSYPEGTKLRVMEILEYGPTRVSTLNHKNVMIVFTQNLYPHNEIYCI